MTTPFARAAQAPPPIENLTGLSEVATPRFARVVCLVESAAAVRAARRSHLGGDARILSIEHAEEVDVGDPVMGQTSGLGCVETPEAALSKK